MEQKLLILAIWLPLFGFLFNGIWALWKKQNSQIWVSLVGVGVVFVSFFIFVYLTIFKSQNSPLIANFFNWITLESLQVKFAYRLDGLSLFMAWIVTGIGALIHLYSTGYMAEEKEDYARFFAYLNLFIFAMLHLVMGNNLLMLFLGWEGVGLCSYLLIGFDYHKDFAAQAGKKAFITNRIGDAGFLLGMFLLYSVTQSFDYEVIYERLATVKDISFFNAVAFFLFIGAMGKSAQIPLYVWLPDAMAGPTPVSALIHAATMVTAGIFMIARLSPIFLGAPDASAFIAHIGGFTALFAALMAVTQTDIKKVLAYSTVSQLGYMFLAMGVGAYGAGLFHLMTHAFFKALLFLGAGAVILSLHHEQDIRKMGGLFRHLKLLAVLFWIATLAIAGIPGLSGFFSKDLILEYAYSFQKNGTFLFSLALITAFLTSFYMFRLLFLVFHTKEDGREKLEKHHPGSFHPPGWNIYLPLLVLGFLSILGGYVGLPKWLTHKTPTIVEYFELVLAKAPPHAMGIWHRELSLNEELFLLFSSVGMAILGFLLAFYLYQKKNFIPIPDGAYRKTPVRWSYAKFYVDELYEAVILKPIEKLAFWSNRVIDMGFVDRLVDGLGELGIFLGKAVRKLQTGFVADYAAYMLVGLLFGALLILGGLN